MRGRKTMKRTWIGRLGWRLGVFFIAAVASSSAQSFDTLFSFAAANGEAANGPLVQGANGNFYGSAMFGGANQSTTFCNAADQFGCGTIFEITPDGTFTEIYDFCAQANCVDGA